MDTIIKTNRIDAVRIYDCIKNMTGSPSYQLLRQEVANKIENVWPEIMTVDTPTEPYITRQIILTSRQQRGLAEGFVNLFNKKDQSGDFLLTSSNFILVQQACQVCKIWNWVKSKIVQEEIEDFDGDLDDDPPISDEESPARDNKKKKRSSSVK